MIAKKLAIQEETTKLKDGCCIVVIQDGETKRMSYKTFLDVMQKTIEESKKVVKTVKLTADSLQKEITNIKPNIYKELYVYAVSGGKFSIDMHKTNAITLPWGVNKVDVTYNPTDAKVTAKVWSDVALEQTIEVRFLLIKY